jgi:hypothetical protein
MYPNGDTFEGEFMNGKRTGRGTYYYSNGDVFTGQWLQNFRDGFGELNIKKKGVYRGTFQNSQKHGEGKMKYLNGDHYTGQWKYGRRHGKGVYCFRENQQKLEGVWSKGNVVEGRWILPGGVVFEGHFKANVPDGSGRWLLANGQSVEGSFVKK